MKKIGMLGGLSWVSTAAYYKLLNELAQAELGVVLGCTEIPLLLSAGDTDVALFPTTDIHCRAAIRMAVG